MRAIEKGPEPRSLGRYRAEGNADYDGPNFTPVKEEIRKALLKEQGYLCAYCMSRIEEDVRIEHWHCRSRYDAEQLDYKNLLCCCKGNEGAGSARDYHCDKRKGDSDIAYNPANPAHHKRLAISYLRDGEILSRDAKFNQDLNERLNLNIAKLKNNRRAVSDGVFDALGKTEGTCGIAEIDKFLQRWQTADGDGKLKEYCDVAVFFLEKRMKRCDRSR